MRRTIPLKKACCSDSRFVPLRQFKSPRPFLYPNKSIPQVQKLKVRRKIVNDF